MTFEVSRGPLSFFFFAIGRQLSKRFNGSYLEHFGRERGYGIVWTKRILPLLEWTECWWLVSVVFSISSNSFYTLSTTWRSSEITSLTFYYFQIRTPNGVLLLVFCFNFSLALGFSFQCALILLMTMDVGLALWLQCNDGICLDSNRTAMSSVFGSVCSAQMGWYARAVHRCQAGWPVLHVRKQSFVLRLAPGLRAHSQSRTCPRSPSSDAIRCTSRW